MPVSTLLLSLDPVGLSDQALLDAAGELAQLRRLVDARQAVFAAEIAHRSSRHHGTSGLAQRSGDRTPERLIERVTGVSGREARTLTRVGVLATPDASPWLSSVGSALTEGSVSVEKADVIATGLGAPSGDVAADDLADAATRLVALAPGLRVEQLAAEARALRDDLDTTGVIERERMLRERRHLTLTPLPDGMTRLVGLLDPESAAIVGAAFDAATSPRRGGPRFVDPALAEQAKRIQDDPRTLGQLTLDAFVDLVRIGMDTDPGRLLGARRHSVRIAVTAADLNAPVGVAVFDGQTAAVSTITVARHICDTGILPIQFDDTGHPLRRGREQRLFTAGQRDALALRDGGCRFPDCDRPASWCEAHHTTPWSTGGRTDISDGILLCRHHHHLTHDNGWTIRRDPDHGFAITPPRSIDPTRTPRPMPSRSRVRERLSRAGRLRSGADGGRG